MRRPTDSAGAWGFAAVVLLIAVLAAGCGSSDPRGPRMAVRGEVRLDGQPLSAGVILFHCGDGDDRLSAVGYIEDGVFEIAAKDGPFAGTAAIEFQAKPIPQDQLEVELERAAKARKPPQLAVVPIPPQYGPQSELTVEVTRSGQNRFDFNLRSKR
ncbi:MAG: hypothetical protein KJ000_27015 [Pirellulaceae bacterium]|nr:hypothetical protein [Pirellulaceae bacterium]